MRPRRVTAGVCALIACLCAGETIAQKYAPAPRPRRPNVVFLLSDDQRPDTIGALGNEHVATPHLDSLVRCGTAFTRAVSAYPLCSPSRAEIMTGWDVEKGR